MWHIYTKEYHSAIKRMKYCHWQQHGWTSRLAHSVKEVRNTNTIWPHYTWKLKCDTNELICKTERDSQKQRTGLWLTTQTESGRVDGEFRISICKYSVAVVVQWLSHVWLIATPWIAAHQAPLSFTVSQILLKFTSAGVGDAIQPSHPLPPFLLLPPSLVVV